MRYILVQWNYKYIVTGRADCRGNKTDPTWTINHQHWMHHKQNNYTQRTSYLLLLMTSFHTNYPYFHIIFVVSQWRHQGTKKIECCVDCTTLLSWPKFLDETLTRDMILYHIMSQHCLARPDQNFVTLIEKPGELLHGPNMLNKMSY